MKTFPVCRDMDWGRPIHVPAHVVEFKFDRCVVQQDKNKEPSRKQHPTG